MTPYVLSFNRGPLWAQQHNLPHVTVAVRRPDFPFDHKRHFRESISEMRMWLAVNAPRRHTVIGSHLLDYRVIVFERIIDLVYFKLRWYDP